MTTTDDKSIADQIRALGVKGPSNPDARLWNMALDRAADIAAEGEAALRAELRQAYTQIQTDARKLREFAMQSLADLGQAQEALERALKAEAEMDALRHDLARIKDHETALVNEVEALRADRALAAIARITGADNG